MLFFTACKKNATNQPKSQSVLLSKIIYATPNASNYGQTAIEFVYNGTQLTKAICYAYSATVTQTANFSYNSQGQPNVITFDYSPAPFENSGFDSMAVFSYNGNVIDSMNVTNATLTPFGSSQENVNYTFTYLNNNLINWSVPTHVDHNYTFDANGNNIEETYITHDPNNDIIETTNNITFDNHPAIAQSIPYWKYFITNPYYYSFLLYTPFGTNNVVTSVVQEGANTYNVAYSYEYNSYGYPSEVTVNGFTSSFSYQFEYITN